MNTLFPLGKAWADVDYLIIDLQNYLFWELAPDSGTFSASPQAVF
jgi:hypothetical protein